MCFLDNIRPMKCKGREVSCAERELSSALDNKIGNFKLLINGLLFSMTEIYFQKHIFIPATSSFYKLDLYQNILQAKPETSCSKDALISHSKLLDLSVPLHSSSRDYRKSIMKFS